MTLFYFSIKFDQVPPNEPIMYVPWPTFDLFHFKLLKRTVFLLQTPKVIQPEF
jgi:hypothetical protein